MKIKKKSLTFTLLRFLGALLVLLLIYFFSESQTPETIFPEEPPVLYTSPQDKLEELYCSTILEAKHSILLIIYSLNDLKIIEALNTQAQNNLHIRVIHDSKTPQLGFDSLNSQIKHMPQKLSGLMHQKILIVDGEKVLIGSANMTTSSLKVHDNLVMGFQNPQIAALILEEKPYFKYSIKEQEIEFWNLPKSGSDALTHLVQLLDNSKSSIKVAMFTFTHPQLTEALIRAHRRGVCVKVILDRDQAFAVSSVALKTLAEAHVWVSLSTGKGLLHHKFAWIDDEILVNGSTNWTRSAFTRNRDCFMILTPLTDSQKAKMQSVWKPLEYCSRRYEFKVAA